MRLGLLVAIAVTLKVMNESKSYEEEATLHELNEWEEFHRNVPVVLYLVIVELLACGACARTAAAMYTQRRHARTHPQDAPEHVRRAYIKVQLAKSVGAEDRQLYGFGFRRSSDGLECLVIETIRRGSLLDEWNKRTLEPSPEELLADALDGDDEATVEPMPDGTADADPLDAPDSVSPGDGSAGGATEGNANPGDGTAGNATEGSDASPAGAANAEPSVAVAEVRSSPRPVPRPLLRQVLPGAAILAVNDAHADVGMMQFQLTRPCATLWVLSDVAGYGHASQFEDYVGQEEELAPPMRRHPGEGFVQPPPPRPVAPPVFGADGLEPARIGAASEDQASDGAAAPTGPSCACLAFEDEEPQILTRWTVCALLFGWVTLIPVLLMQPHEERPRQQLFRQFLRRPGMCTMPIWIILWVLDCCEIVLEVQIMRPYVYFGINHMIIPGILVWFLVRMQAADERLVLEQRSGRCSAACGAAPALCIEDPSPTLLKEMIMMNPVALVWLGASVSIPLLVASLTTPLQTERGRMAQGYVHLIYGPMVFLQLGFAYVIYHVRFVDLPKLYLAGLGVLLTVPCFVVWCLCLVCASRYGRKDLELARSQRLQRGREAREQRRVLGEPGAAEAGAAGDAGGTGSDQIVDCGEALSREWEMIYSA